MQTLILYPKTKEQLCVLKAIAKALKVKFEIEGSPYDPEFVKKILQAREDHKMERVLKSLWRIYGSSYNIRLYKNLFCC